MMLLHNVRGFCIGALAIVVEHVRAKCKKTRVVGWYLNALLSIGSVGYPQGRVVVGVNDGRADPQARVPYPEQAVARKAATTAALAAGGVKVPDSMPPLICEDELTLRRVRMFEYARTTASQPAAV